MTHRSAERRTLRMLIASICATAASVLIAATARPVTRPAVSARQHVSLAEQAWLRRGTEVRRTLLDLLDQFRATGEWPQRLPVAPHSTEFIYSKPVKIIDARLKEDLAPGRNPTSLEQSRLYLELSDFLCCERAASEPVQLLSFYCTSSLMGKMTLGRLSETARLFFIVHLARALSACGLRPPSPDSSEFGELAAMRRQVVDALTIILRVRVSHPFFHTSFK